MENSKLKGGIKRQVLIPMVIVLSIAVVIIYTFLNYKNEDNIVKSAVIFAEDNIKQFILIRKYYAQKIVPVVKNHSSIKIAINPTNRDKTATLPLPATVIHELSEEFKKANLNLELKLYSNYPFYEKKKRVFDNFEKNSLVDILKDPDKTF
ncbi:MAG: DUF3365 domain-containing protein, partial [Campylobacteraceae bacterium]|nr:DUF3365 domain-containing protein [Campylobacteraceae bacterium]